MHQSRLQKIACLQIGDKAMSAIAALASHL